MEIEYEEMILQALAEKTRSELEDKIMSDSVMGNKTLVKVMQLLYNQTEKGIKKYGHAVDSDSLSDVEWIDHTMEELVDTLVYLQCLKQKLYNKNC